MTHITEADIIAIKRLHERKTELDRRDGLTRMENNELRRINRQIAAYAEYAKAELEDLENTTVEDALADKTVRSPRPKGLLYWISYLIMMFRRK